VAVRLRRKVETNLRAFIMVTKKDAFHPLARKCRRTHYLLSGGFISARSMTVQKNSWKADKLAVTDPQ
jgi:hypothetical protein